MLIRIVKKRNPRRASPAWPCHTQQAFVEVLAVLRQRRPGVYAKCDLVQIRQNIHNPFYGLPAPAWITVGPVSRNPERLYWQALVLDDATPDLVRDAARAALVSRRKKGDVT